MDVLKKVAVPYKGKALFVTVPPSENRVYEYFEVTDEQLPTFIVADMGSDSGKYLLTRFFAYYIKLMHWAVGSESYLVFLFPMRSISKFYTSFILLTFTSPPTGMKKYPFKGPMEEAPLIAFLNDYFDGKVEAYLKSEAVRMQTATVGRMTYKCFEITSSLLVCFFPLGLPFLHNLPPHNPLTHLHNYY